MDTNTLLKELNSKYLLRIGRETNYFYSDGERIKEGDIVEIYNDPRLKSGNPDIFLGEFILKDKLVVVFCPEMGDHILTYRIKTPCRFALKYAFYEAGRDNRVGVIKAGEVKDDSFDFRENVMEIYKNYSEIYDREYRKINPPQEKPKESFLGWLFN